MWPKVTVVSSENNNKDLTPLVYHSAADKVRYCEDHLAGGRHEMSGLSDFHLLHVLAMDKTKYN